MQPAILDYAVEEILDELYGRSGFDHWWDNIDSSIQQEVKNALKNRLDTLEEGILIEFDTINSTYQVDLEENYIERVETENSPCFIDRGEFYYKIDSIKEGQKLGYITSDRYFYVTTEVKDVRVIEK